MFLWLSPWAQITECRYRFSKMEDHLTDNDLYHLVNYWMYDFDWWPWGMTTKRWKTAEIIPPSERWKNISKSGMAEHIENAAKWAERINNSELKAKTFQRLTDASGRHLGDKQLASKYLKEWISATKVISNEDQKLSAFHEIAQIVGGLGDREHGLLYLENIASDMRKFNSSTARGYGFRSLAEASGQLGAREHLEAYWDEARQAADLATTNRNDIYWRPITPEVAFILMSNESSISSIYFSESLSYVNREAYGFDQACYFGDLAKTAALYFDTANAIYFLNQIRNKSLYSKDDSAKHTLIAGLADAAEVLSDKKLALTFLENLRLDTEVIQDDWSRSLAFQALAAAANSLGDKHLSFEYFAFATEAALQEKTPVTRVWHVAAFLLDNAKELEINLMSTGLLQKLEAAVAEVATSKTGDNQGLMTFVIYRYLAEVAVQLGAKEKGLYYLSQAKSLLTIERALKERHGDILALAQIARDLRELSQARKLAQLAFDMAKKEISGEGMRTIVGVAKLLTSIGKIRWAFSLAETEGFSKDVKVAIIGMVLAEYAENHYPANK